ncbi:hypothetical protein [Burkholderia sp. Ac-20365]|uniref:hypothetical protein n=1 Tax=Burkholderia sp. Ac-20365 TaxID=2703897 RepID=UPI00197C0464|nr:hypothetical protein [Burkholderia sp. Ac-20365]MBN3761133.1 hypothetical protein [Burkholderia sp. Ac-20365]
MDANEAASGRSRRFRFSMLFCQIDIEGPSKKSVDRATMMLAAAGSACLLAMAGAITASAMAPRSPD